MKSKKLITARQIDMRLAGGETAHAASDDAGNDDDDDHDLF